MNSLDARVRYTKKVIEESFLELLQKKHVSKVTVTEICQKCQINRATFYKHYLDVPDLLEKLEESIFDQIRAAFKDRTLSLEDFLADMLMFTQKDGNRYMILGSDNGDPNLMAKTFMICYESVYPLLEQNFPNLEVTKRQMLYHFLSQGSGGILTYWIRNGMKEDPKEVTVFLLQLCSGVMNTL